MMKVGLRLSLDGLKTSDVTENGDSMKANLSFLADVSIIFSARRNKYGFIQNLLVLQGFKLFCVGAL